MTSKTWLSSIVVLTGLVACGDPPGDSELTLDAQTGAAAVTATATLAPLAIVKSGAGGPNGNAIWIDGQHFSSQLQVTTFDAHGDQLNIHASAQLAITLTSGANSLTFPLTTAAELSAVHGDGLNITVERLGPGATSSATTFVFAPTLGSGALQVHLTGAGQGGTDGYAIWINGLGLTPFTTVTVRDVNWNVLLSPTTYPVAKQATHLETDPQSLTFALDNPANPGNITYTVFADFDQSGLLVTVENGDGTWDTIAVPPHVAPAFASSCSSPANCTVIGAPEGQTYNLSCPAGTGAITIEGAHFGADYLRSCASYVATQCDGAMFCAVQFSVQNCGGDPESGVPKYGSITYRCVVTPPTVSVWFPPAYPAPANAVNLSDRGVLPNTGNDVVTALNNVLASLSSGQTLVFAKGTYQVGAPVRIPSGVNLYGPQDAFNRPLATIEQITDANFGDWGPLALGVLMNADYQAAELTDQNMTITALNVVNHSYGVLFRMAKNVTVQGCNFTLTGSSGQDGTAFLASETILVTHNLVTNSFNAAYDSWDGNVNLTVSHNLAALSGGYGMLFNAVDTDGTVRTASTFTADHNIITGAGNETPDIWVSPLCNNGCVIIGPITITNNAFGAPNDNGPFGNAGIVVNSESDVVLVQGNTVANNTGGAAIAVGGDTATNTPSATLVLGNLFLDDSIQTWGNTLAIAQGQETIFANNNVVGGSYPILLTDAEASLDRFGLPTLSWFANSVQGGPQIAYYSVPSAGDITAATPTPVPGLMTFGTPCPANSTCTYGQESIENLPLALTCAAGTMSVAGTSYGVAGRTTTNCTGYVQQQCQGAPACLIRFSAPNCSVSPFLSETTGEATIMCSGS